MFFWFFNFFLENCVVLRMRNSVVNSQFSGSTLRKIEKGSLARKLQGLQEACHTHRNDGTEIAWDARIMPKVIVIVSEATPYDSDFENDSHYQYHTY